MIQIEIPGPPISKKRPRFARRGNFVTTYNDQETEEGFWALRAIEHIKKSGTALPLSGAIRLSCIFNIPRPKSHYTTKGIKKNAPAAHVQKSDLDNLVKFVMDCLNRCNVWGDDCQVVSIVAEKKWADFGHTSIKIHGDIDVV